MNEKTEVELKKEDRNLLKSVIEAVKPQKAEITVPEKHEHWKASELINPDCPECKAETENLRKLFTNREEYPLKCSECGTPVKKEEEKCVNCGSTEADER